jgi:biotin transporter BioY
MQPGFLKVLQPGFPISVFFSSNIVPLLASGTGYLHKYTNQHWSLLHFIARKKKKKTLFILYFLGVFFSPCCEDIGVCALKIAFLIEQAWHQIDVVVFYCIQVFQVQTRYIERCLSNESRPPRMLSTRSDRNLVSLKEKKQL